MKATRRLVPALFFALALALAVTVTGCDSSGGGNSGSGSGSGSGDGTGSGSTDGTDCVPATCVTLAVNCGVFDDGCGGEVDCGECGGGGGNGGNGGGAGNDCVPATCASLAIDCGSAPDGCNGTLDCGDCPDEQFCGGAGPNLCGDTPCDPATCESLAVECGSAADGCGALLDCGGCGAGFECGQGAQANTCVEVCQPATCESLGVECGPAADGCGGNLICGGCTGGASCVAGACVAGCTPTTCQAEGYSCGSAPDGCDGTLDCGGCGAEQECVNNQCVGDGCTPKTCNSGGWTCGDHDDDCSGTVSCGECGGGLSCLGGQCVPASGCEAGAVACTGTGSAYQACGYEASSGDTAWGPAVPCFPGQTCSDGACSHDTCVKGEVMILIDHSSSMTLFGFWDWVKDGVEAELDRWDGPNLFGYRLFPTSGACDVGDYFPLAKNDAYNWASLPTPNEGASTPIEAALSGLEFAFGDPNDGEIVILLSDGDETCSTQEGAVEAASTLRYRGVDVHVLALGDQANITFLDEVASVGGTDSALIVDSQDELEAALAGILLGAGLCGECSWWTQGGCDGDFANTCDDDEPVKVDCSELGGTCGVNFFDQASCVLDEGGDCDASAPVDLACDDDMTCYEGSCCDASCSGKECGSDGCGGSCGTCNAGDECTNGLCACEPECGDNECGDDGCGGSCGTCASGQTCKAGQCSCVPACSGKECGDDGCGGSCGTCTVGTCSAAGACELGSCQSPADCGGPTMICDPDTLECTPPQCGGPGECGVGDICLLQADGASQGACYEQCNTAFGDTCSGGKSCSIYATDGSGFCVFAGTQSEGQSCDQSPTSTTCSPGTLCLSNAGTSTCSETCSYWTSGAADCSGASACSVSGFCFPKSDIVNVAVGNPCAPDDVGNFCGSAGVVEGVCITDTCIRLCRLGEFDCNGGTCENVLESNLIGLCLGETGGGGVCGADPGNTCMDRCDDYDPDKNCQCDAGCASAGDCCADLGACCP